MSLCHHPPSPPSPTTYHLHGELFGGSSTLVQVASEQLDSMWWLDLNKGECWVWILGGSETMAGYDGGCGGPWKVVGWCLVRVRVTLRGSCNLLFI
ncbi:hypothetical protein Hanom_Chr13g01192311 [Helianthus anomalus]